MRRMSSFFASSAFIPETASSFARWLSMRASYRTTVSRASCSRRSISDPRRSSCSRFTSRALSLRSSRLSRSSSRRSIRSTSERRLASSCSHSSLSRRTSSRPASTAAFMAVSASVRAAWRILSASASAPPRRRLERRVSRQRPYQTPSAPATATISRARRMAIPPPIDSPRTCIRPLPTIKRKSGRALTTAPPRERWDERC